MKKIGDCSTKYPILMVHGMGFRDRKILCYWGRIPKILRQHGASVFFGNQDANASIEFNGAVLKNSLKKCLAESGADKVNIIAHSKGGAESRFLASSLGMSRHIASITTISTPHNGSSTMDKIMKLPTPIMKAGSLIFDVFMAISGDKKPDTYRCLEQLTTSFMSGFNRKNPDVEGIYYQSFAFEMKNPFSDILMAVPFITVKLIDGRSDGFLTAEEVSWGNFRGIYTGTGRRGISHLDEVDMRRMRLSRKEPRNKNEISDITQFYLEIVSELKGMGL